MRSRRSSALYLVAAAAPTLCSSSRSRTMRSPVLNARRNGEDVAAAMPDDDVVGDRWGVACSWLAMGGGTMAGAGCE